jgi:hypothetical protein
VSCHATAIADALQLQDLVVGGLSVHTQRRLLIRVEQGKGRKDRYALLSPRLLEEHCSD